MIKAICRLFCGSVSDEQSAEQLRALLRPQGVGIVSARCCAPTSAAIDDRMLAVANEAMRENGRVDECLLISITDAQRALARVGGTLAPAEQRLVTRIQSLVTSEGFSVFPVLVIDQEIAFYGGLPTTEMVASKLQPAAVAA